MTDIEHLRNALVERLEAENDTLRERNKQLEAELGMRGDLVVPLEWGLTAKEEAVMRALIEREIASKEYILGFVYNGRDEAEPKIVDVFVHHIRKKIGPFGVKIETVWGRGYTLDKETRARFGKKPTGVERVHAA